jgi:eukaryotic-like serine/threonine-protein kinase
MNDEMMIAGRYRIDGRLGVGGMSTVHLAFDDRLERNVAIKLLAEHLADDPTFVSRFRREALSAARLVHPNIVQVFDFGFDERQHRHFIVMEHVPGNSCAELLRDRGHLEVGESVDVLTQACRGLEYAHRNGVVHRDVKPGNLLVSDTDVVKLADFGIARATDQSSITQVGSVLGTAAYLAPEQARGEEAGPRADIYSLGVVAYQLMSGRLPYEAVSLSELALKQQRESPTPLDELNPQVPPELALAVSMALAIDKEARPRDGMVFADALQNGLRRRSPLSDRAPTTQLGTKAATRVLPDRSAPPTAATRVAPRPPTTSTQPVRQLEPRPVRQAASPAAGAPRGAPAPVYAQRRRGGSRVFRRFVALLAVFAVLIAAVVVAIVIASSTSSTVVRFRTVVGHDAQTAIDQVRSEIDKYTK